MKRPTSPRGYDLNCDRLAIVRGQNADTILRNVKIDSLPATTLRLDVYLESNSYREMSVVMNFNFSFS
jgi:hypothetical protein